MCYVFNINHIYFKTVCRRTEMTHQQRLSPSGWCVTERAVGESRQRPLLALVLQEDILSTRGNKNNVM